MFGVSPFEFFTHYNTMRQPLHVKARLPSAALSASLFVALIIYNEPALEFVYNALFEAGAV